MKKDGLRQTYYAIWNGQYRKAHYLYLSYPYMCCVFGFDPDSSMGKEAYLWPAIHPNLDEVAAEDRELVVKKGFEKQGMIEQVDFKFISLEELEDMVTEHNKELNKAAI
ncbi:MULTISPECIES: hypothetical protein [Desulfitobacterium]|uniref:Uncharacterized protein n=1 Tax=Desulfitobacterium chlororespirans DSM 11544 TaxID=1121395 RepID=A0A1M7UU53_9FIRM|nr:MULTISPECIES: hypothetical protein [Desulfitobacterium]SHN86457.1 hypothetical protein SAMN02745215_04634 [Desulfitobacterium chlororespirans DSM 11544]